MKPTTSIPSKTGIYICIRTDHPGDFLPCLITKINGGVPVGFVAGVDGNRVIVMDRRVQWLGPFTIEDIMAIPESREDDVEFWTKYTSGINDV